MDAVKFAEHICHYIGLPLGLGIVDIWNGTQQFLFLEL